MRHKRMIHKPKVKKGDSVVLNKPHRFANANGIKVGSVMKVHEVISNYNSIFEIKSLTFIIIINGKEVKVSNKYTCSIERWRNKNLSELIGLS